MSTDVPVEEPAGRVNARPREHADAWNRGRWWWHAFYGLVFVAVFTLTLLAGEISVTTQALVTALLVGLASWYALAGRLAVRSCGGWLGPTYLAGALALFVPIYLLAPWSGLLLVALCPQCFTILRYRRATLVCLAFNTPPAVTLLAAAGWSVAAFVGVVAVLAVSITFSAAFGSWITGIIVQSSERAELIERLENSRAEVERLSHEKGVLAERERLAAEIHDTLAQGFTSILMLVQAAQAQVGRDPAEAGRHLDLAARSARENLTEARALVAALAPTQLESSSLHEALARLAERVGGELGVHADFHAEGSPRPLAAGAEVVLLRACQEGLANVRKHARAGAVRVRLAYGENRARLELSDDGGGFEPGRLNGGFGLAGMRSRVEQVGGQVNVASAPGSGTMITVEVPA